MLNLHWPDGKRRIPDYSSSRKDWSCWAGFHPPMKADACAPFLGVLRVSAVNNTYTAETPRAQRGGAQRSHGRLDRAAPVAANGRRAQCGRPGQGTGSTRRSSAEGRVTDTPAPQGLPRAQGGLLARTRGSRPTTNNGGWLLSDRHAQRSPHWGASVTALVLGGSTFISPPAPNAPQAAPAHTPAPGPAETSVPRGAANNRRAAASARPAAPAPAGAPCAA